MKNLLILGSFIFVFASCKKDKQDNPIPTANPEPLSAKTVLLAQGAWELESWTLLYPFKHPTTNADVYDMKTYYPACRVDNIITFKSDGLGIENEGSSLCFSGQNQNDSFTWKFDFNEGKLKLNKSLTMFGVNSFNIETLTADLMKLKYAELYGAESLQHTLVFKHK